MIEAGGELGRRKQPNARGGEFQGERQPIESPADLANVRGVVVIEGEVGVARLCAVYKHGHRVVALELDGRGRTETPGTSSGRTTNSRSAARRVGSRLVTITREPRARR